MVSITRKNRREARYVDTRWDRRGAVMWTVQDVVAVGVDSLLADGTSALECDGDLSAGRRRFDAAYREAERLGDAEAMAAAAIGMGGLWVHEHRTVAGAALLEERVRRALALVDPRSPTGVRLRARLAGEQSYRTGDPAPILAVLDEATDPVARAEALSIAHHCLLGPEHHSELHLVQHPAELLRERTGDVPPNVQQRGIESKARFHADRQEVDGVRQRAAEAILSAQRLLPEDRPRYEEEEHGPEQDRDGREDPIEVERGCDQPAESCADDQGQALNARAR